MVRLDVLPGSGEGFLVGDAVNTAARLEQLAPPMGIVVGETTQALSARSVDYARLDPVALKGKRAAVKCWLVRGPLSRMGVDPRQQFPAALVDREVELGVLRGLLKKVHASAKPQFALVSGEPGIGKSRLVFELLRYIDSRPAIVRWRQGRCPAYGDGLTFWALGEIFKEQLGVLERDEVAVVEAKLAHALAGTDDREWLAARLRPLLGLEGAAASREENFAAWRRFLEIIASDCPAVVVFEDLHWASEGTLAFLRHLVENCGDVPLLLIGTTRPELFHARPDMAAHLAELGSSQRVVRLDLEPLSASDTQELVVRVGRGLAGLPQASGAIAERSAGNPLFAEQLVCLLEEEGGSSPATEVGVDTVLREKVARALPESLQSLIAARLDGLPPERKTLLGDAAVVGEVFWTGAVAALDRGDRVAAEQGLDDLAQRDFVRPERDSSVAGENEFAFRHSLIRDVAYAQLTRADRAAKHAAVARWVEATAGERVDEVAEILAHHYLTALELAEAGGNDELRMELLEPSVHALELAGDRALALDVDLAERHYAKAVELAVDGAKRPYLLVAWAEALKQSGRLQEAADALDRGVRGLNALGDDRAAKAASTQSWYAHWLLADGQMLSADEVAELAHEGEASPELVVLLESCADRVSYAGHTSLALQLANRSLAMCAELGLTEPLRSFDIRGDARCALGDAGGLDDLRHALELARARQAGHWTCIFASNLGECLNVFEGPEAALQVHREGLELARRRRDQLAVCVCSTVVFIDLVWAGRWDAALVEADDLERLLEERKDVWDLVIVRATRGLLCSWRGDTAAAAEKAAWAEERSRETPIAANRVTCLISLAGVEARLGNEEAALRLLDTCGTVLNDAEGTDAGCALRMPEAIRLAIDLGRPVVAQRLAEGLPAARPFDAGTLTVLDALLREHRGDHVEAAARFAAAGDRWCGLGVPYEQAQAQLGRGRCLAALGKSVEAQASLAAARDVFATLGAEPALREVEALLETIADRARR